MRKRNYGGSLLLLGGVLLSCCSAQPQVIQNTPSATIQNTPPYTQQNNIATRTLTPAAMVVPSMPTVTRAIPTLEIKHGVNQWFPVQIPRAQHTATILPNGRVLLIGGSLEPNDFVADEELIDPKSGLSDFTAPLHTVRHGHTATLLQDGRILVVGGYSLPGQWLSDAEIYDPVLDAWSVIPPLYPHGVNHTATLMQDGRVLVVGGTIASGYGSGTDRVEIFNPETSQWEVAAALDYPRASHTAQLLEDGRVLIAGGGGDNDVPDGSDGLLYDPLTDSWKATNPMVEPRHFGQSVRLSDGQILVVGGAIPNGPLGQLMTTSVEIYNPVTNTWRAAAPLTEARYAFVLTLLPNGTVLAIGGAREWDSYWTDNSFVREIEMYDPRKNQWQILDELPQPRAYATGTLLPDGSVWIAGGQFGPSGANFPPDTWLIVP